MPEKDTAVITSLLSRLDDLYAAVDRQIAELLRIYPYPLTCHAGCRSCCVDNITVFEIEARRIRQRHEQLLHYGKPFPEGACAFLNEADNCRIYEHRPYVCRTQGLPLRWIDEDENGAPVEMRDICPLNEPEADLTSLHADLCWTIGNPESQLAQMQESFGNGKLRRVALRALFHQTA
jgi:hypothetical protein